MTSKDAEHLIAQAQIYQQQMQTLLTQKNAYNLEIAETRQALEDLGKSSEKAVFKVSGPILIKHDAAEVKKQLQERATSLEMRLKVVTTQEERIRGKIEELRESLLGKKKDNDIKVE